MKKPNKTKKDKPKMLLKEFIFKLEVNKWNKQKKADQDKALLFMYRVLYELSKNRKFGYSDDFIARDR